MSSSTAPSREAGAADTPPDVAPPLVEAKLAAPRVRRGVVVRPRLLQALDAGGGAVLTLVGAPAGYGKTTAVRMWCATQDAALAWVTLDAGDNDPSRMWTYVATAVDRIRAGLGQPALRRLGVGGSPIEAGRRRADERARPVRRAGDPRARRSPRRHRSGLPGVDRSRPSPRARERARDRQHADRPGARARHACGQRKSSTELRAADLAFTSPEAHALLVDRVELELSDEQVDVLVERTEGWPAALVLAGLWLRTVDDPSSAVSEFGGDQHFVADYLSTEVLAALDDDRRAFLQGLSVLGQFTPELCDAVLDRADSAEALARARARQPLRVTTRARTTGSASTHSSPSTRRRSSRRPIRVRRRASIMRAATWLRERGRPIEAIAHASAAGEHEVVAELLAEQHLALIRSGAGRTLLHWARTLPDDALIAHPEVAVAAAITTVIVSAGTMERRRYLGLVDQAQRRTTRGAERVRRGRGPDLPRARDRRWCRPGGGRRSPCRRADRGAARTSSLDGALTAYARALYFAGDLARGQGRRTPRAGASRGHYAACPTLIHAHTTLALVAVAEERLSSARTHAEQATGARRTDRIESELARRERLGRDGRCARGGGGARGGRARARHRRAVLPRRRADASITRGCSC